MVAMENGRERGTSRRKSCIVKDNEITGGPQNFGTRARNFLDRAMGRSGEQRHLIEVGLMLIFYFTL